MVVSLKANRKRIIAFVVLAAIVVGATLNLSLVWKIADTLNGLMAIPNLIALLGLSGVVVKTTRDYFRRPLRQTRSESQH